MKTSDKDAAQRITTRVALVAAGVFGAGCVVLGVMLYKRGGFPGQRPRVARPDVSPP